MTIQYEDESLVAIYDKATYIIGSTKEYSSWKVKLMTDYFTRRLTVSSNLHL
jgi:hypothetical protein